MYNVFKDKEITKRKGGTSKMKEIEKLKRILASDLTDTRLAEIAGMSQQAISKYRNGLSKAENMRVEQALKLIKFQEELNMKHYVNDLTKVLEFDGVDFNLEQDENGIYCLGTDLYEWLVELDNAINTLEENNVNILSLRVNEYQDYIDLAKRTELENKILTYIDEMDEEIRNGLYDVYLESNGNLWFTDSGMAYDGDDKSAKEVAQVEDGEIINLY